MPTIPTPLSVERVRRRCDPAELGFETTAELEPLESLLGQARAEEALSLALEIPRRGFNAFVIGAAGIGKHGLVRRLVEARAQHAPVPDDWVYVFRFEDPDRPRAMRLPAGRGVELAAALTKLTDELGEAIRGAFETDEFRNRARVIEQKVEARHEEAFSALAETAESEELKLLRTPAGLAFAPVADGKVIDPKAFAGLPKEEQERFRRKLDKMEEALGAIIQEVPRWQRAARDEMRALEREMAGYAAAYLLGDARARFEDLAEVTAWLDKVEADVVEHAAALVLEDADAGPERALEKALARGLVSPLSRYRVNVLVDRSGLDGAPVVQEDRPTLARLVGTIDQRAHLGALVSDFTLIKSGALHEANGGTLIIDARRLLSVPGAYEALERALRRGELEIESFGRALGISTGSLDPDPIPLDLKVVLIGERRLYYLLRELDPEFEQLFKVLADLEDDVPWDPPHQRDFARLVAAFARDEDLLPFTSGAVARVIEHAARACDDQRRLTTALVGVADVAREAEFIARKRGAERVEAEDVRAALDAGVRREGRARAQLLERFADRTLLLATAGEVVGQINGLSVMQLGSFRIGRPNRITCRVRLGKGELVDIERESELGGPAHSKGVMILAGYLGATYAAEGPLSVHASLVFEQSYGGVDGDSASLAELCCLLSAVGGVPIRQGFALTGSVNQLGEVQAIGGVNEKIEGFFDVCAAAGLDGSHAVMIPPANVPHLMLREDIVEAIAAGRFAVYEAGTVDEAIMLLTGIDAGVADADGLYPEDSVHGRVQRRLAHLAERTTELRRRRRE